MDVGSPNRRLGKWILHPAPQGAADVAAEGSHGMDRNGSTCNAFCPDSVAEHGRSLSLKEKHGSVHQNGARFRSHFRTIECFVSSFFEGRGIFFAGGLCRHDWLRMATLEEEGSPSLFIRRAQSPTLRPAPAVQEEPAGGGEQAGQRQHGNPRPRSDRTQSIRDHDLQDHGAHVPHRRLGPSLSVAGGSRRRSAAVIWLSRLSSPSAQAALSRSPASAGFGSSVVRFVRPVSDAS